MKSFHFYQSRKTEKIKSIQGGGGPAKSLAQTWRQVTPVQERPVPEMQVYQSSRKERHLQGARAGSQEGQGCPQAPRGTNRGTAPRGEQGHSSCQRPELCRSASPAPRASRPCRLGDWDLRYLLQELTLELESWLPPVWLFLLVSLCLGQSGTPRNRGLTG